MDGLLRYLAKGCGREAEFIGTAPFESNEPGSDGESPDAADVTVSNPAGDAVPTESQTQSETSIAVNPTTGTVCAAWNDSYSGIHDGAGFSGFGRSTNAGATFTDMGAVNPLANFDDGDPSLVWRKHDGNFYYAALKGGGLGIYRSTDDCTTFTFVAQVSSGSDDKELLAVDNNPASPFYGRMYIVWKDFGAGSQIVEKHSTDAGSTWSAQIALSTNSNAQGPWPVVAPNGDIYSAWIQFSGPFAVIVSKSTNGGVTWAQVAPPMSGQVQPQDSTATSNCGRAALKGNIRYLPSPQIAVDESGNLHAVYTYDPDGQNVGDVSNVYYRKSTDGGATWATEVQINDDGTTTDQYQPSLSVGAGSIIAVGYYSKQNDAANNLLLDYYSRVSYNGGASWQPSSRLSDVSSAVFIDPNLNTCYHGDYDSQVHTTGKAIYLWSDDRRIVNSHNDPDVYSDSTPAGVDYLLVPSTASQAICTPADAVYPIDLFQFQGFSETVTLGLSGHPAGTTAGFSTNPAPVPGNSTLTVGNTGAAAAGSYTMTVTGTSTGTAVVHTTDLGLEVFTSSPAAPTLLAPADGALDQARSPLLDWSDQAGTQSYTVEVATDAGFSNVVRTANVAVSQWAVTPALDITTLYFWRISAGNVCGANSSTAFSFTTATPTVLLVDDDDDSPDVAPSYVSLLNSLVVFDTWNVVAHGSEPTVADLEPYKSVIWFSGDRFTGNPTPSAGPQTAGETALGGYLGFGRCLLISSQDYLWDMGGAGHNVATPFMTNYLGLASGTSDTGVYTRVNGLNIYSALVNQDLTYPYTNFSDVLVPTAEALIAFRGVTPNTNVGAISKETSNYLTTYMSFGVETLPAASQDDLLNIFFGACDTKFSDLIFADGFGLGNPSRWSDVSP